MKYIPWYVRITFQQTLVIIRLILKYDLVSINVVGRKKEQPKIRGLT